MWVVCVCNSSPADECYFMVRCSGFSTLGLLFMFLMLPWCWVLGENILEHVQMSPETT